jgi:hypothetical protein
MPTPHGTFHVGFK